MGGGLAMTIIADVIATLQHILTDPDSRDSDKINAARTLMSGSVAFQERKLLEREIRDIRNQLDPQTIEAVVIDEEDDE